MAARARNSLRRPVFIAAVSVGAFVTALVALVIVPQQAQREARELLPRVEERVDTTRYSLAVLEARARIVMADSALAVARANAERLGAFGAPVILPPELVARRDSLEVRSRQLAALTERAANAPLTTSYRALADADAIRDEPVVRVLRDSLEAIDREREAFSVVGPDPVFVSLSAVANDIGRRLRAIAESRQAQLRSQIRELTPPPPPTPEMIATADTLPHLAELDLARSSLDEAVAALDQARTRDSLLREREARAVHLANFSTPLGALLAAALVIGAAFGFGAAFWQELRMPHLADEREAERVSGIRALGTVRPQRPNADRGRRATDQSTPPYLEPGNDGHQLAWLHAATATQGLLILSVTGEDSAVASVVAANLAAISAEEARSTLLIDTNVERSEVAAALQVPHSPGIVDILEERADWAEATVDVTVGRSGSFDVVPAGRAASLPPYDDLARLLRQEVPRLAKRYDTVIVVASAHYALAGLPSALPEPHVICCARPQVTTVRSLRQMVDGLQRAGCNPLGVVVWDDASPRLPSPETGRPRPAPSREMQPA